MKTQFSMVLLLVSAAMLPLSIASTTKQESRGEKPASAWSAKDLDGKTIHSSDYAGKVVILDFWATWCPPCRQEIPGFIELQKQYGRDGLVIIGASVDQAGTRAVKAFSEKFGIIYPVVLAPEKMQAAFGDIDSIPTTFIIDRQGHVVRKHVGFVPKQTFEKEIKPLLTTKK